MYFYRFFIYIIAVVSVQAWYTTIVVSGTTYVSTLLKETQKSTSSKTNGITSISTSNSLTSGTTIVSTTTSTSSTTTTTFTSTTKNTSTTTSTINTCPPNMTPISGPPSPSGLLVNYTTYDETCGTAIGIGIGCFQAYQNSRCVFVSQFEALRSYNVMFYSDSECTHIINFKMEVTTPYCWSHTAPYYNVALYDI